MAARTVVLGGGSTGVSRLSTATFVALNLLGILAYIYPFLFSGVTEPGNDWFAHNADGPLIMAGIAALCLVLVVSELTEGALNSKSLAVLGVLAAMAAVLRAITLPAGASLYFFLVILGGYVFGTRMGFLLGAMSFLLSALVTAGVGPWLPFQVFAAGWMGLSAGALGHLLRGTPLRAEVAGVVALGAVWGLLYGAIANLWSWPFFVSGPDISYEPGLGLAETVRRYWNFYLLTSFGWDLARSVVNVVVLLSVGIPLLKALKRFHSRFIWERG
jgi:energy-coupling factor transport system substrate-specific component